MASNEAVIMMVFVFWLVGWFIKILTLLSLN